MSNRSPSLSYASAVSNKNSFGNIAPVPSLPQASSFNASVKPVEQLVTPPLSCLTLQSSNNNHVQFIKHALERRGWVIVSNDVFQGKDVTDMMQFVRNFCFSNPPHIKQSFAKKEYPPNRFGYFATDRKEGYRFMTGSYATLFSDFIQPFQHLVSQVDNYCLKAFNNVGKFLFSLNDKQSVSHIPLLGHASATNSETINYGPASFGLFDIVRYLPANQFPAQYSNHTMQVDEHVDPGLFSISMGATAEGLQLYDPHVNTWYSTTKDQWVLWCGTEAERISNGKVKAAKHRVVKGDSERVTAWFEVCVEDQVPADSRIIALSRYLSLQGKNQPLSNQATPFGHLQQEAELFMKEFGSGIPMSKSGVRPSQTLLPQPQYNSYNQPFVPHPKKAPSEAERKLFEQEFSRGIPMSKSGVRPRPAQVPSVPQYHNQPPMQSKELPQAEKQLFANEFNFGIPMSKSGVRPSQTPLPQPQYSNHNRPFVPQAKNAPYVAESKLFAQEFNSGIPMSKSGVRPRPVPPPTKQLPSAEQQLYNAEFNYGIPMSKAMAPPQVSPSFSLPPQSNVNYNNVNNNNYYNSNSKNSNSALKNKKK